MDIVIRNEKEMDRILFYLLFMIKSIDGAQNSAIKYIELKNEESKQEFKGKMERIVAYGLNE